MKYNW